MLLVVFSGGKRGPLFTGCNSGLGQEMALCLL